MRLKLIACEVLFREMCDAVARSSEIVDIEFLPKGLHDMGGKEMSVKLQEAVDKFPPGRMRLSSSATDFAAMVCTELWPATPLLSLRACTIALACCSAAASAIYSNFKLSLAATTGLPAGWSGESIFNSLYHSTPECAPILRS